MPKVDDNIKKAILAAAKAKGSQAKVALAAGITPAALTRYLRGTVTTINTATWSILYPVIKDYLPIPVPHDYPDQLERTIRELDNSTSRADNFLPDDRSHWDALRAFSAAELSSFVCACVNVLDPMQVVSVADFIRERYPSSYAQVCHNFGIEKNQAETTSEARRMARNNVG